MNIKDNKFGRDFVTVESKLQNATSVKDLTQADVATIEGLVVMDFMTPSMLRAWSLLACKEIARSKEEVLRTTFDFN
jgi:hypothetical protein